jgi:FAD binding domain
MGIDGVSTFSFAAQLAERYRSGRVFLVGDAAHRMTPRGGTGMNTAIHDAYDLGWKLAWTLRGWAPSALLDTYEAMRRPIGEHNVARSGSPNGARQAATEALPYDLNGRIAHHWVAREGQLVSTVDLIDVGLTRFSSGQCKAEAAHLSGLRRATTGRQPTWSTSTRRTHWASSAPVLSWFALTAELFETLTVELCEKRSRPPSDSPISVWSLTSFFGEPTLHPVFAARRSDLAVLGC